MVSGLETQDVVTECLEAGACDYLYKPVNVDDLKMTLIDWAAWWEPPRGNPGRAVHAAGVCQRSLFRS